MHKVFGIVLALGAVGGTANGQTDILPKEISAAALAEAKEYSTLSDEAKALVKTLRKIDVLVEGGVNYREYRDAVKPIRPDVTVFCESNEAKKWPTLAFLLDNAAACHATVSSVWNKSLFASDPREKQQAKMLKRFADQHLWRTTAANTSVAQRLVDGTEDQIAFLVQLVDNNRRAFTVACALDLAQKDIANLEAQQQREREDSQKASREVREEKQREKEEAEAAEAAKITPEIEHLQKVYDKARASLTAAQRGIVATNRHAVANPANKDLARFSSASAKQTTVVRREKAVELARARLKTARQKVGLPPLPANDVSLDALSDP